jgi:hypothetical protein
MESTVSCLPVYLSGKCVCVCVCVCVRVCYKQLHTSNFHSRRQDSNESRKIIQRKDMRDIIIIIIIL